MPILLNIESTKLENNTKQLNTMKEGTKLKHKSGRVFEFVREYDKQFAGLVVDLFNTKTKKTETFLSHTYRQFFQVIED